MKRILDITLATILLGILFVPMLVIALAIKLTSRGPIVHDSTRIGKHNVPFRMPKFRTMRIDTPQLATHLLPDPERWITPVGKWLRKTSLDELPQLWSILRGDMSFVGPRPALFNQHDLVEQRTARGIDRFTPGLTGWAQINGRDNLSIPDKVALDEYYAQHCSLGLDAWIVLRTFIKVARGEDVVNTGPRPFAESPRRAA